MAVALGGFLFAFSESMFYIINVFLVGNANLFIIRLILTVPMHMITTIIILAFAQIDRRLTPVGLIFAILMHYMFNLQTF